MKLVLPIASFEKREHYIRENIEKIAVHGINDHGYAYIYIEYVEPHETGLTLRLVPVKMDLQFDDYGVNKPIGTYWMYKLFFNGIYIKDLDGSLIHMETSHADMIPFTASLGINMVYSIINGEVRAISGFDTQPLYRVNMSTGKFERVPDEEYDTTLPPSNTYYTHLPDYIDDETEL